MLVGRLCHRRRHLSDVAGVSVHRAGAMLGRFVCDERGVVSRHDSLPGVTSPQVGITLGAALPMVCSHWHKEFIDLK